ncbi:MAG: hypothetical protein HOO06_09930 [Bdellovibrionaceae bacterium]|nr:hypothetical protein [Pseudobdellovibrionaceae bacterium]
MQAKILYGDNSCYKLFADHQNAHSTTFHANQFVESKHEELAKKLPEPETAFEIFSEQKAVNVGKLKINGEHGQGEYTLKRISDTWQSKHATSTFTVEGNPTWVISILGSKLAASLGIRLVDERTLIIPNAQLLNLNIQRINIELRSKGLVEIPYLYIDKLQHNKWESDNNASYGEIFLRRFFIDKQFPLAEREIIHDISFHILNILLTEKLMSPIKNRMLYLFKFADYLRTIPTNKTNKINDVQMLSEIKIREEFIKFLFQIASRDLDNLSAFIPLHLIDAKQIKDYFEIGDLFQVIDFHLGASFASINRSKIDLLPNFNYKLKDWLDRLIVNQAQFIYEHPADPSINDYKYFINSQNKQQQQIQNNLFMFFVEVNKHYETFVELNKKDSSTVLARYNDNMEVTEGLASNEHPVTTMQKRIVEIKSAIGITD